MASEQTTISVDGPDGPREMRVSSPNRLLWPELGLTKLDLARYFVDVGEASSGPTAAGRWRCSGFRTP
jgi:DNA primase